jgi:cyclic pyranopterin phosphate synthase
MLKDKLGRVLKDLRLSLTDRCNLRCSFCMPPEKEFQFLPREELLSFEEMEIIVEALAELGVRKVRLTGGEPLLRRHIDRLISRISAIKGIEDIALTTNGFRLKEKANLLKESGLKRITVSVQSLKDEVYSKIVGRQAKVSELIEGIEECIRVGLVPVKVNTTVVRGLNDEEIVDIARFFKGMGVIVRFIEYMDVGTLTDWDMSKVVSGKEIIERIGSEMPLEPVEPKDSSEVSKRFRYTDDGLEVGVITSITEPFCRGCSRIRLSADGKLYTCLFAQEGFDVKALVRQGADKEELKETIREIWLSREDRYSELRLSEAKLRDKKVEMFRVGG